MQLFELFAKIGLKDEEFKRGIAGAVEKGESFGARFGSVVAGVGKAAAVGLGAAATAFGGLSVKALQLGGDLEQSVGGIETLFKTSADAVIQNAEKAYLTAGISANDYMQQVTSFSASLLQSLGGDTKAAADVANMAVIDMADNANKMGTAIESIQSAYQGFAKQNYTMLDNLKLGYGGTKEEMDRLLKDAEKMTGIQYDISNLNDVYLAIHAIQEELGITGTTAKEGMETLTGSFTTAKAALSNFLSGAGGVESVVDSVSNLADVLLDRIGTLLPRLTEGLMSVAQQLIPQISPILSELLPPLLSGAEALLNGVIEALPSMMGVLVDVIPMAAESILSMLPLMLQTGIEILISLAFGIADSLPALVPVAVDAVMTLVETLLDNIDMLVDAAIAITVALADGLIYALPALIEKAPVIIAKLVAAIVENVPKLLSAAWEIVRALAYGIVDNLPEIGRASGQIVSTFLQGITAYYKELFSVGKNIVLGLWEGISSMGGWLWGKIKGFFDGIVDGVKDVFQIASPSKLFAWIGEMNAVGFVQGIESMAGKVASTIDSVLGYRPDVDYQALIDKAVHAGDMVKAAQLEAQRNLKIEGEGLGHMWEKTLKYASYLPGVLASAAGAELPPVSLGVEYDAGRFSALPLTATAAEADLAVRASQKEALREAVETLADRIAAAISDTVLAALPETLQFYFDTDKVAESTFAAFENAAARRNRMYAPSSEQVAAIARAAVPLAGLLGGLL